MRRRQFKTQADVDRFIAQGFGAGEGEQYRPWLRIQDVSSNGRSRKVQGTKVNRIHHLLSDFEYFYLLLLEFSEQVVDIREHFPLFPTVDAQQIAANLDITYPRYPSTLIPFVMTTDFLITLVDAKGARRLAARTLRYENEFEDAKGLERRLEKFVLERAIWHSKGVADCKIVTANMICGTTAKNLQWLRKGGHLAHCAEPHVHAEFRERLAGFYSNDRTLGTVIRAAASASRISYPDAVLLFKQLVWRKEIIMNIREDELQLTTTCPVLSFPNIDKERKAA